MFEESIQIVTDDDEEDVTASWHYHAVTIIQSLWCCKKERLLFPLWQRYLLIAKSRVKVASIIGSKWHAMVERCQYVRLKCANVLLQAHCQTFFFWSIPGDCSDSVTAVLRMKVRLADAKPATACHRSRTR
jgi:hypothetical protein